MVDSADTCRARAFRSVDVGIWCNVSVGASTVIHPFLVIVVVICPLVSTASHTHIPSNTNTAALLCNDAAEVGASGQSGELLRAIDRKWDRDHLQSEVQKLLWCRQLAWNRWRHRLCPFSGVLRILGLLKQVEAQTVNTLMSHRKVGEDKVSSLRWSVQICHTSYRDTSQNWAAWGWRKSALSHGASGFQSCEEEEIGVIGECDIGFVGIIMGIRFEDTHFDNRGRINRATVRRRCSNASYQYHVHVRSKVGKVLRTLSTCTASSGTLGLLHNVQSVRYLLSLSSDPADGVLRLVDRSWWWSSRSHFDV